jgi:hypothetical protein
MNEEERVEKPKVLLILLKSEDKAVQIGLVKDCHGSMPIDMVSQDCGCENVGYWSRFDAGTFYVELTTSVEALQDNLIQHIAKMEAETREYVRNLTSRIYKVPVIKPIIEETFSPDLFSDLRKRMGAGKVNPQ